jgi:transcriptional regulator with XRE-family HTH domain
MPQSSQSRIAMLIKAKMREARLGLRESAQKAHVSAATLSRLSRGLSATLPDVETLERIAKWIGISVTELLSDKKLKSQGKGPTPSTPEIVEGHLRADRNLAPETASALAQMFKVLYEQSAKKPERKGGQNGI